MKDRGLKATAPEKEIARVLLRNAQVCVGLGIPSLPAITAREREVLALISAGLYGKEIAAALDCSERTVKFHRRNIYRKLGVSSRSRAVAAGRRLGLLGSEPGKLERASFDGGAWRSLQLDSRLFGQGVKVADEGSGLAVTLFNPRSESRGAPFRTRADGLQATVSAREREVLALIGGGLSNREIAAVLDRSESTVKFHRRNIYRKLEVCSRSRLIAVGRRLGLLGQTRPVRRGKGGKST